MVVELLLAFALSGQVDPALEEQSGQVVRVIDGDTIELADKRVIRLTGVDAPEMDQPGGKEAKRWLEVLLLDRAVQLNSLRRIAPGRQQALVIVADADINGTMVMVGYAMVHDQYAPVRVKPRWTALQAAARTGRIGMWALDKVLPPWEWRDRARLGTVRPIVVAPAPIVVEQPAPMYVPQQQYYQPRQIYQWNYPRTQSSCPGGVCPY